MAIPGLYFGCARMRLEGCSPMNKTLQIVLTALALAGTFCAISNGRKTASDVNNPDSVKAVLYADGTDPMPACRNKVCPPADN